jgi:hypothetical protein
MSGADELVKAVYTVPPSYLYNSLPDTLSRPSFSLNVPAELKREKGKFVVMLEQKWYSLIRPWITRYQRLYKKYKKLPVTARFSWIPSISFNIPEASVAIGLSSLVHWMAEGWMGIGCIADPITVAIDWENGTGEITEGNGILTRSRSDML